MWNKEQHMAKKQKYIYREPTRYVLYFGGIGRPASTIQRVLYDTEWTNTLFFHTKENSVFKRQTYDLYKGSRKQVFVRRYHTYVCPDNWIRLRPNQNQPEWMVGKTHEEIREANKYAPQILSELLSWED
jgi:hypothetical protein